MNTNINNTGSLGIASIEELKKLTYSTVGKDREWYLRYSFWEWLAHRVAGTLIIILSVSLPFIVSTEFVLSYNKDLLVSLVGVSIALLSSLNSFFNWGEIWKANMYASAELKNQLADWELKMLNAKHCSDEKEAYEMAVKATIELFEARKIIDDKNSDAYFKNLKFPDNKK